ncbi:MAG: MBL fold metallo-hydrolase [Fibrobacterota bacterium]
MSKLTAFALGPLSTNCYLLQDHGSTVIIDPSHGPDALLSYLKKESLVPDAVILTHGHFDHFLGVQDILITYAGTPVYLHPADEEIIRDPEKSGAGMIDDVERFDVPLEPLQEGMCAVGGLDFRVFHVPGHTPGGTALYRQGILFSGDTLFAGAVGRSDFRGYGDGALLIRMIREKLLPLPDDTQVFPGHGPATTIGAERHGNPFLT